MEKVVGVFIALSTELSKQCAFTVCWVNMQTVRIILNREPHTQR